MKKRKQGTRTRSTGSVRPSRAAARAPRKGTFALAAECTVAESTTLRTKLSRLLDWPAAVTLDVAALQRIDTAGMQLIAAFVRERGSHGRQVQWRGTTPTFASAARLLGLASVLGLPPATP